MLTKRNLFILIGLLVLLDLASFFVYFMSHINRDGKNPIEYVMEKTDTASVEMDSVPAEFVADKFDTIARIENYVSKNLMQVGATNKPMTCSVKIKFVCPKSINDNSNLDDLYKELMRQVSSNAPSNVNDAVEWLLNNPEFAQPSSSYTVSSAVNPIDSLRYTMQRYRVFPYISTHYLLEMVVLVEKLSGKKLSREMNIVHYNRVENEVIGFNQIFNASKENAILALINRSIAKEKKTGNHPNWHEALALPSEFLLGKKSVIFYFADGDIAPRGTGLHQISVSNQELDPFFTDFYKDVLKNDGHLIAYNFVSI